MGCLLPGIGIFPDDKRKDLAPKPAVNKGTFAALRRQNTKDLSLAQTAFFSDPTVRGFF
jgi:hypothetical protein